MTENEGIQSSSSMSPKEGMVHFILSHSYTVFMLAVVFGLILDVLVPVEIFHKVLYQYAGAVMIVLGSILIYWAQSTSGATKAQEEKGAPRVFARGPYKYNRSPTHVGLSIMTLGLGFLLNSAFSVILIVIAYIITKTIYLKEEEALLVKRYGAPYIEYQKKVRNWL